MKKMTRLRHRLRNAKWWIKHRIFPRHRFHVVQTGLEPGYYDPDTLILHASMACLGRYIKEMGGLEEIDRFNADLRDSTKQDPNAPEGVEQTQADRQEEAATIWRWWTIDKPADEALRDKLWQLLESPSENWNNRRAIADKIAEIDKKIDDDEQTMLHRLIDIRESLWT